ncbi:GGDEF domain-containing protein [Mangrovitalea sediminis]|uniref:GGDEF domain-containing protein n=1 Tax=Mangrovitalea sediminis TaxID=1982043 RepID=UPI000BE520BA|nr:GGDEF domain-containing protein [Mangrovitalea sediminis]
MTETRLRTRTHLMSYGIAVAFFVVLANQNLLYGFYDLFYGGLILAALALAGIGYTLSQHKRQLRAPGHFWIAVGFAATIVSCVVARPSLAHYWLYPLLLLNLLLLPPRPGLALSAATTLAVSIALFVDHSVFLAISTLVSALLVTATAGFYAWRYHHNALSVAELSIVDPVTGAYNARYLEETLAKELSRGTVTGHPLSLLQLQIDYYGELEDLHGSSDLQPLLQGISEKIGSIIRAGDSHYYTGDGNFFLILPFTPEEGARVIAERIRRTLAESRWPQTDSLSVSLGCTTRQLEAISAEHLMNVATRALREAQQRGHNRVWHHRVTD